MTAQHNKEISYWRKVIKRVVPAVRTLVSPRLSLREDEEKIGLKNYEDFLMLLEFLNYDAFMNYHIKNYTKVVAQ